MTKTNLLKKLMEKYPTKNAAYLAVQYIKEIPEMERFFKEYVGWIAERSEEEIRNPVETARSNIMTMLGYSTSILIERRDKWINVYNNYIKNSEKK